MPITIVTKKAVVSRTPERKLRLAPAPAPRKKPAVVDRGDLLAVPLCILWGAVLWLSLYGPWSAIGPMDSATASTGWLSFLWSVPAQAGRFLMGR